ncbi:MAG: alpha-L-arabinofuranosidase [Blastocatellia bacterium]|nr:MAG: alpha-L-arabinofuranosidase [Blastocatellia bacterium]
MSKTFATEKLLSFMPRPQAADSRIEILAAESIGTIAPEIYGHFTEHLGGVIYDGVWVGEDSKIPNVAGIRKSLIDALLKIKPSVIRWPGGCFADSYNWRNGIGPKNTRPRTTNFWAGASEWPKGAPNGPGKYETNQFGTDDFLRFCKLTGAQPYIAANLRSLNAKDFYEWVEYCNSPAGTTSLADLRAVKGEKDGANVRFWGIGNESWGCGGNFTPEEYAAEYRRFTAWVPGYGVNLAFVGAGPNGGDLDWTRRFFTKLNERRAIGSMWGWAMHHYSWNVSGGRTNDWREGKGDAVNYQDEEWYELLHEADRVDSMISDCWNVMGEIDRTHRVKLVVDEWGAWYKPGSEVDNTHLLGQQSTIRDAVLAGQTLDTFHRHADKVGMAAIAQLVNCLQSLFLAHEDKFVLTPTYHVFDMYSVHQGKKAIRTVFSSPRPSYTRSGQPATIRGLNGSASLDERRLVLTVTNPDPKAAHEAEIALRGATVRSAKGMRLSSTDIHAHNSFAEPNKLAPQTIDVPLLASLRGSGLLHTFPPASVTRIDLELG